MIWCWRTWPAIKIALKWTATTTTAKIEKKKIKLKRFIGFSLKCHGSIGLPYEDIPLYIFRTPYVPYRRARGPRSFRGNFSPSLRSRVLCLAALWICVSVCQCTLPFWLAKSILSCSAIDPAGGGNIKGTERVLSLRSPMPLLAVPLKRMKWKRRKIDEAHNEIFFERVWPLANRVNPDWREQQGRTATHPLRVRKRKHTE